MTVQVGDVVRALDISGYPEFANCITVVEQIDGEGIRGQFQDRYSGALSLWVTRWEPVAQFRDLRNQVVELSAQLERANERFNQRNEEFRHDIEDVLTNRLNKAADRHEWCGEYDDEVDALNNEFHGPYRVAPREQEFQIERLISGRISTTITVTVKAKSQDDAEEMVDNMDVDEQVSQSGCGHSSADDLLTERARYDSFEDIESGNPDY